MEKNIKIRTVDFGGRKFTSLSVLGENIVFINNEAMVSEKVYEEIKDLPNIKLVVDMKQKSPSLEKKGKKQKNLFAK